MSSPSEWIWGLATVGSLVIFVLWVVHTVQGFQRAPKAMMRGRVRWWLVLAVAFVVDVIASWHLQTWVPCHPIYRFSVFFETFPVLGAVGTIALWDLQQRMGKA